MASGSCGFISSVCVWYTKKKKQVSIFTHSYLFIHLFFPIRFVLSVALPSHTRQLLYWHAAVCIAVGCLLKWAHHNIYPNVTPTLAYWHKFTPRSPNYPLPTDKSSQINTSRSFPRLSPFIFLLLFLHPSFPVWKMKNSQMPLKL